MWSSVLVLSPSADNSVLKYGIDFQAAFIADVTLLVQFVMSVCMYFRGKMDGWDVYWILNGNV